MSVDRDHFIDLREVTLHLQEETRQGLSLIGNLDERLVVLDLDDPEEV